VVFLFGRYVQTPFLMGKASMPFWAALFIGNIVSVTLLNWLVPWASQALGWWLNPPKRTRLAVDIGGAVVVCALYSVILCVFFMLS
jgi:antibiotic biosynthesis monooxygenase (ABM) superfamily enzyme